ncbi:HK97 family phage prohead protease [Leisingera sp. NJS201]|uniref:HK97 family phage prohead protease n=1 Tax=Leisingera sp. NJS201 TaxID=2508306 RepID=UPI00107134DB|nr:HK97 family phage prohead protease [Leisingera sp. NJS201]QBR35401.1 HK97 family phage prohead protease [Leisingera sp. NJS201]
MTETKEFRASLPVEVRAADENGIKVAGYAAVFDEWADIGGYFQERIMPGVFEGRLEDDVQFLVDHRGLPLARNSAGNLSLSVDERGLAVSATLPAKSPTAQDVAALLEAGTLSRMSFAFTVAKGGDEWDESGPVPRRSIHKLKRLYDVSVVSDPAYAGTEIGLRSLEAARAALTAGNPQKQARARRMRMDLALAGLS